MSSFTHRCTEEHIHKLINAPWSFHNTTRVAWLGELHQTQRKQLTLLALRNKLSLFPLQTRNRMEMLSEAWSGRKRRNRWHAERKEGQEWGQNAKDEERVGKFKKKIQTSSLEVSPVPPNAVVLSASQAATGRQAENILSLKVLTAPPPSLLLPSLMSLLHSFPCLLCPCSMNPRLHRHQESSLALPHAPTTSPIPCTPPHPASCPGWHR